MQLVPFPPPSDEDLSLIIEEIKRAEPLLSQGLLREQEFSDLLRRAHSAYEAAADHDSIQYRKYDKSRRQAVRWRPVRNSGYVELRDGASLMEAKQRLVELLNLHGHDVQPSEMFIAPGSEFTGRVKLRNILSRAAVSIAIKDDYPFSASKTSKNIEILTILGPYLDTSLNLQLKILGSSRALPSSVVSDIKKFLSQYPNTLIKGYSMSESGKKETHGRFIIIDGKEIYVVDHSLKDLGSAQASINKVNNPDVAAQYVTQFNEWWAKAAEYTELS